MGGENRRMLNQARPILLAVVGRESPDPTPVRDDAAVDLGVAGAERVAHRLRLPKSGAEGGESEQCLRNRLRGSKRDSSGGQKRAPNPCLSHRGQLWWQIPCVGGQDKRTMRESEVQIGNSG